jgi:hypothetical protein
MPIRHPLRLAAAVGLGLVTAAAAAAAASDTATFDLAVSGVHVGTVTLRAEEADGRYAAASKITPSALVGAMTGYAFDGRSSGVIDAEGRVSPVRFAANSSSPRAKRRTEIEWDGATPTRVSVEPPRRHAPDPARVVGALDPVSAGFALLRDAAPDEICDTSLDVFDGSRRSRLSLAEPVPADGGFTCAGVYARLEGEAHTMSAGGSYPFTLVFVPNGDGLMRLERVETRTRFGPAVIRRRG